LGFKMPPVVTVAVSPARRLRGRITVPGDKSISHRYAILAALADGRSELSNYAPGADCRSTLACVRRLGTDVKDGANGVVTLLGRGLGRLRSADGPLDAGNSGTTIRLLAGVLAGYPFTSTLVGDESLSRRPMRRVIAPLAQMGATLDAIDGHPPLTIHGGHLRAIHFRPETPSAQVKSAVLLAGLHADGTTRVTEPAATRDHTERALAEFGGHADVDGLTVSVEGGQELRGQSLTVPGDFSSAAFWLVAAAILPGSRITIDDVGLNPTRTALLAVLRRFGARVDAETTSTSAGEPRGTVTVEADTARGIEITPDEVPGLIDELPAIAALAGGGVDVVVRGAAELRVKESDRIATIVRGFRALGFEAEEAADGYAIRAGARPAGGAADAHGDHRMAMAFAIAALAADGPSTIDGADAVSISYPAFFETLPRLVSP
jgi:3-phosphoshikimate 1-carboxyvinyltransferase